MNNKLVLDSVTTDNDISNISTLNLIRKTHCIVCKSPFLQPRAGKLYCSNRCKQFVYNHKENKTIDIPLFNKKVKQTKKRFLLEDYASFIEMANDLKRYKELYKRNERFIENQRVLNFKTQIGLQNNPDQSYLYQLNSNESDELQILSYDYEILKNFDPPFLSIEQWSFFKAIYKKLENWNFFRLVCQISKDYIQHLNLKIVNSDYTNLDPIIKIKYIKHCNEITDGLVQFI